MHRALALVLAFIASFTAAQLAAAQPLSRRGGIDLDGNGRSALIVRSATNQMQAGRLVNGVFQWTPLTDPGPDFVIEGAVDLAGNGKSDLLMLNLNQGDRGDVVVWKDFDSAQPSTLRQVRTLWRVDAVGDLDGDGFADIVWRFTGNSGNIDDTGVSYIWFTNGNGVTQVRKRGGAPLSWTLLGAADLNNDGAADMVYVSPSNDIRVLMATANRTCANISAGSISPGFVALKLANFNGYGFGTRTSTILARNPRTGEVVLHLLNAAGVVLPPYTGQPDDLNASCTPSTASISNYPGFRYASDPTWTFLASGDFDGDGITDILWQRPDGTLTVWLMNPGIQPTGNPPTVIANAGSIPAGYGTIREDGSAGGTIMPGLATVNVNQVTPADQSNSVLINTAPVLNFTVANGTYLSHTADWRCGGISVAYNAVVAGTTSGTITLNPSAYLPVGQMCQVIWNITGRGLGNPSAQITQNFTTKATSDYTDKVIAIKDGGYPYMVTKTGAVKVVNKTQYQLGFIPLSICDLGYPQLTDGKVLTRCSNAVATASTPALTRVITYINPVTGENYDYTGTVPANIVWHSVDSNADKPEWSAKARVIDGWFFTPYNATTNLRFQADTGVITNIQSGGDPFNVMLTYNN